MILICPKCSKRYSCIGWLKRHLQQKEHGIVWITYYSSNVLKEIKSDISAMRLELKNLKNQKIVGVRDSGVDRIKREEKPEITPEMHINFTFVIKEMNLIFSKCSCGEHLIKPSETLLKN